MCVIFYLLKELNKRSDFMPSSRVLKTQILSYFEMLNSLKYNTFFSVNDTLILVVVFHKALSSRGAGQST